MRSLYDPAFEYDACGVGFVADINGRATHRTLELALESVVNLTHRGAVDADAKTGDGAGVLTQLPRRLLARELFRLGVRGVEASGLAVAMVFFPRAEPDSTARCREIIERTVDRHGLPRLAWREVPVDPSVLGDKALATQPDIQQLLVGRPLGASDIEFERVLYLARKEIERRIEHEGIGSFYIPSFSHRTLVYKGLFVAPQLRAFYLDLQDTDYETAVAVFHQRYSTNTFPTWFLAQPFRLLAHNGEINTLQGNRNWMEAREPELVSPHWGDQIEWLKPICWAGGSDSASLDNALEAVHLSGRDILHSMMMLVPEAWEWATRDGPTRSEATAVGRATGVDIPDMDPALRAFYEYHACLTEPWDGPAALAFSDGTIVAAALDRNGLRPARYKVLRDGLVIMASEVGVIDVDDGDVLEKGRLGPGEMIAVDTARRMLLRNHEIKRAVAASRPYGDWLHRHVLRLEEYLARDNGRHRFEPVPDLVAQLRAHGYTYEDLKMIVEPMAAVGENPRWSMGDDTPIAVLSEKPRGLYNFFRQRFAQVTNPPIDPLREENVMSLDTYLGPRRNLFAETDAHAALIHASSPFLVDHELAMLKRPGFKSAVLSTLYDAKQGCEGLRAALDALRGASVRAVDAGHRLLILCDRGVDVDRAAIPALLATATVHHHLIRERKRMRADVIVETGEAWEIHHFACLVGYGAAAFNPYLALAAARSLAGQRGYEDASADTLVQRYRSAAEHGLLKIMSKMGISTLSSYRGAQIFEAVGVSQDLIDECFTGTPSRVEGIGLEEIAAEVVRRHGEAFGVADVGNQGSGVRERHAESRVLTRATVPDGSSTTLVTRRLTPERALPNYGFVKFRRDGEYHGYNIFTVQALHRAVQSGEWQDYQAYLDLVYAAPPRALRDVMEFRSDRASIPIDDVEPTEQIRRRFASTAMSLGALSPEAHHTLAIAMNRMGCRSNTGEGGEDPDWWPRLPNGDWANSKIKQVASGRFGVTPQYLAMAEELEIKMAQGSKPGEGGELPARKVSPLIARLRHAIPGIGLISPPPHHDIYSIEDLAQLIHDLKQANPQARVGVKLVAESGVGTIAAGVAKAYADYILISGHDGGTGASPLSSIKNAGCPWEIGLSETQQVLVMNDLRGRVRLRTDGGLKTGRDVIVAAMLGAEEFGFGTTAVVAMGCDMARQCHLDTCPTGIATQRPDLRAKFAGTPERVINFFTFLASEVRHLLAQLGYAGLDDVVGRCDLLVPRRPPTHGKAPRLDLTALLAQIDPDYSRPHRCMQPRNDRAGEVPLDETILRDAAAALSQKLPVTLCYRVRNSDRTVGTRLCGEIAQRYGDVGLPDGTIRVRLDGTAGQSFGAWLAPGVHLELVGEANDYVGKGMAGGEIVVRPPDHAAFASHENVIVGNTVLYGATGGRLFVTGRAGERFAVRNSGATAVVEGVGDHCCEYMTGGVVVVLGETGRNFGAGMSHGQAYVLDERGDFPRRANTQLTDTPVTVERVHTVEDASALRALIQQYYDRTGSKRAAAVLARWDGYLPKFWAVIPHPVQVATETAVRGVSISGTDADDMLQLRLPAAAR